MSTEFNDISSNIMWRLKQTAQILEYLKNNLNIEAVCNSDFYKIQKGFIFVSMYSSLEYVTTQCVSRTLEIIAENLLQPSKYKKTLLCLFFDSHFKSLRECSSAKVWDKRKEFIFSIMNDANLSSIDCTVFPSGGSMNISKKEIENIWLFFDISNDYDISDIKHFLLNEIKDHRNAIAHGREHAIDIGKRYNVNQLESKATDIRKICFLILQAFTDYCTDKRYLIENYVDLPTIANIDAPQPAIH